jgi:hypothetical protein
MTLQEVKRYFDPSPDFMSKISFHMLCIAMYPHRSIEFTEMFMKKEATCEHTQRVCTKLIYLLSRYKTTEEDPTITHIEGAAKTMWNSYFHDQYVQAAGGFLKMILSEMSEPQKASPDCLESASR